MDTETAAILANTFTQVLSILIAVWYVAPWMRRQSKATSLTILLWVHAPRYIALQVFSAQQHGFAIPDALRDQIAYGDLACAILAAFAIVLLRYRSSAAILVTYLFLVVNVIDLLNAMAGGIQAGMMAAAHGITWLILAFYVPILFTTTGLIAWVLLSKNGEPSES